MLGHSHSHVVGLKICVCRQLAVFGQVQVQSITSKGAGHAGNVVHSQLHEAESNIMFGEQPITSGHSQPQLLEFNICGDEQVVGGHIH